MKRSIVAIAAAVAAAGLALVPITNRILFIPLKDESAIRARELDRQLFTESWLASLPVEERRLRSPGGYDIQAAFIEPYASAPYAICCHGVTESKTSSLKYARLLIRHGYNAVVYDHRRHGGTGGAATSYGSFEKEDLAVVVQAARQRPAHAGAIGIHGVSMGAATALLYAGAYPGGADFYIADCSFSLFAAMIGREMRGAPRSLVRLVTAAADPMLRLRGRFSLRDASPYYSVDRIQEPVLFLHSQEDDYIDPSMSVQLFERKRGPKQLEIFPKGEHAAAFYRQPAAYEQTILDFLRAYGFAPTATRSLHKPL